MFFVIYVYLGKLCNWISNICRSESIIKEEIELTTIQTESDGIEPENDFIIVDLDEV